MKQLPSPPCWTALIVLLATLVVGRAAPPNILLIVADDLGFSDLGCYGGEIATPHLDALAAQGLRFTQFYNTARCWSSRAAILTGYYAQQVRRDTVTGVKSGTLGTRPAWAPLLPALLRPAGYRTYHSGKWHLDGKPLQNGFDRSYSLEDHDRYFTPHAHTEDDVPLAPVAAGSGYYATTAIADHAIRCLKDHASEHGAQPFFEFLAFTSPHFPLQAPPEEIARYRGKYLPGWEVIRKHRWEKMESFGIGGSTLAPFEREIGPPYAYPEALQKLGVYEVNRPIPWENLTPGQQQFQAEKMSIHAAMVDRMDQEIGRVLAQVKSMGALENTLILFLSDNGASAEMMVRGDGHDPDAACGTGATFLSLGPGWSTVANTPFRRHKTWVHEGGMSTSLILRWGKGISRRGKLPETPGRVVDLLPTLLEVAGVPPPNDGPVRPGISLVPLFTKDGSVRHSSLWWLHEENRALRMGNWKIVASGKSAPWELYDLSRDRSETHNLAAKQPRRVRTMAAQWELETDAYAQQARQELTTGLPTPPVTSPK